MAYTRGFEHDIFVSYARVDDTDDGDETRRWVNEFVRRLRSALALRIGGAEQLRIFFDQLEFAGNQQLDDLLMAARRSAVFLALASPAYALREWPRAELAAFHESAGDLNRLFAVEYMPLEDGMVYPDPLNSHNRLKFWVVNEAYSLTPVPRRPDSGEAFQHLVHDLAARIKAQFNRLNEETRQEQVAEARSTASALATQISDEAERRARGVVYLAQSTDDLEDEAENVRRELDQFGFWVLPREPYPQGGPEFRAAAERDIADCDVFVQLLGPRPGRAPPDLPEGYPRAQLDIARANDRRLMLWRRPDLDLAGIANPDHARLLADEAVIAGGLESFKAAVRDALAAAGGNRPLPPSMIFVNVDESDREVANVFREEFEKRDLAVFMPMFSGTSSERYDDLTDHIKACDVLLLLYGNAPLRWVRSQALLYHKLRPQANARGGAVLLGPPDQKPLDLGFNIPGLRVVGSPAEWSLDAILALIEELQE